MRTFCITIFILSSICCFGQENCFENCNNNFEKSTLAFPEKNQAILDGLIGCRAPDFKVQTMSGETLSLSALKGKIVVLNFWFIECAPCIAELPALNMLVETYKGEDVVFIAFARNDSESLNDFRREYDFKYKIVSSVYSPEKKYCMLGGWPTNIVIDKNGIVRKIFTGGYTDERAKTYSYQELKPLIDEYLLK